MPTAPFVSMALATSIFLILFATRHRLAKVRKPVNLFIIWLVPVVYMLICAISVGRAGVSAPVVGVLAAIFAVGLGLGCWRVALMRFEYDQESGKVLQSISISSVALILGTVIIRSVTQIVIAMEPDWRAYSGVSILAVLAVSCGIFLASAASTVRTTRRLRMAH
jgi:uncharacterized membrane protein YqjE